MIESTMIWTLNFHFLNFQYGSSADFEWPFGQGLALFVESKRSYAGHMRRRRKYSPLEQRRSKLEMSNNFGWSPFPHSQTSELVPMRKLSIIGLFWWNGCYLGQVIFCQIYIFCLVLLQVQNYFCQYLSFWRGPICMGRVKIVLD